MRKINYFKSFVLVFMIASLCTLCSCNIKFDTAKELAYTPINNGSAYEVSGIGTISNTKIVIPSTYRGKPVVSIGKDAFLGSDLTEISIPDSVTSIGYGAFYGCLGLESITIGNGVKKIDDLAFGNCENLTSITIPDSVIAISEGAFYGCSIQSATMSTKYIPLLSDFKSTLKTVIITGGESIEDYKFAHCTKLESVTISNSVTSIGEGAFYNCSSLKNITIPKSVTIIGDFAFDHCQNLTILAEAESAPSGWSSLWNSSNCPVTWGTVNNTN